MLSIRRIAALIKKEGLQIIRDPSSIIIAFVLPLLLLFLFGYGLSLDAKDIRIGIALEDSGMAARDLMMAFRGSARFLPDVSPARQELLPGLVSGVLNSVLVIPHGFSAAIYAGRPAVIQLLTDGVFPNNGHLTRNYSLGLISGWIKAKTGSRNLVEISPRFMYNGKIESRHSILPGIIAIIMALIGTMLTSLVIAREWERGTMEAILGAPARTAEVFIGKLAPYYLLAICSVFFSLGIAAALFGIPFHGSLFMLFAVSSLFMMSSLGQGLLISTLTRNQYLASFAGLFSAFLPTVFLSGFVFEIDSMPVFQRALSYVLPGRYLVNCLLTLFLAGDVKDVLIPNMLKLAVIGSFFIGAAFLCTRERLE